MRLIELGPLPLTLIASLTVAVVLLAIRVFVMQRVQSKRQRENRQESERLRSLVGAYRTLAGSFSPGALGDRTPIEEALAEIVLFGSTRQVELAAACAGALVRDEPFDVEPLVRDLRADLRNQLGLDPIPPHVVLPRSGPSRSARQGERRGGAAGTGGGAGGAGGGGGEGAAAGVAGAAGLGSGLAAGDAGSRGDA
jgi:hypothetical protein